MLKQHFSLSYVRHKHPGGGDLSAIIDVPNLVQDIHYLLEGFQKKNIGVVTLLEHIIEARFHYVKSSIHNNNLNWVFSHSHTENPNIRLLICSFLYNSLALS